jgi:hypothetical protein
VAPARIEHQPFIAALLRAIATRVPWTRALPPIRRCVTAP